MTSPWLEAPAPTNGRVAHLRSTPTHVTELRPTSVDDRSLVTSTRRITGALSAHTNRLFYAVVLGISLTGAGLAARGWLDWHTLFAFLAVAAVELGGVALSVHAEERRRKGERAVVARILSALVAVGAVAVNWFGHSDHTGQASFFAGMSALGYTVWLIDSGARRRDALRQDGKLDETAPFYGLEWGRHPWLTRRARTLALADPTLGRQGSLAAARAEVKTERRQAAISAALRERITKQMGEGLAEIAVQTYDLDEIAKRLAEQADYDRLTAIIAADLLPERVAPLERPTGRSVGRGRPTVRAARRPTVRSTGRREPTPTVDRQVEQPTVDTRTAESPTAHAPTAVENARQLRARYGDSLPSTYRIREDMKWSADRAKPAVAAYRAGADLNQEPSS